MNTRLISQLLQTKRHSCSRSSRKMEKYHLKAVKRYQFCTDLTWSKSLVLKYRKSLRSRSLMVRLLSLSVSHLSHNATASQSHKKSTSRNWPLANPTKTKSSLKIHPKISLSTKFSSPKISKTSFLCHQPRAIYNLKVSRR